MAIIGKDAKDKAKLDPTRQINLPAMEVPSFRFVLASERRVVKNILIMTPNALGDCVCAEPAIRFAALNFKGCEVSIVTPFPDLYRHIPLKKVYNRKEGNPDWDQYNVLQCYHDAEALQSEFVHNFNMAIGDYIAVCLFKGQIPVRDRNIVLSPRKIEEWPKQRVVIHAGKHWVSKTFPKYWWDEVVSRLIANDIEPTLIGATMGERGTVDLDTEGCIDLRDKLTVMQSTHVLQNADIVLTNDSAPFHIAASGSAWIGVMSTVRHIDFINHWRPNPETGRNEWGYKVQNLAEGQMWQNEDTSPARNGAKYDVIDQPTLVSWLPTPESVVAWVLCKLVTG